MRKKKTSDKLKHDTEPFANNGAKAHAEENNEKPPEEVNDALAPQVKKPFEAGTEAPIPEIDPPVGDGSNNVDTPIPGTEIVLSGGAPEVLDVTIEEPDYPSQEWRDTPEILPVVPDDNMTDEALVAFVHERQGSILRHYRTTIQEHWLIGRAHHLLFLRHGDDKIGPDGKKIKSRWREDWLPRLGYNHTSDQQLRVLATEMTLEEAGQFPNKNKALQALGFSVGGVRKAIEQDKKERGQEVHPGNAALEMAQPLGETVIESEPQGVANHKPFAKGKPAPKVQAKASPEHKIAAKAAPQAEPLEEDPMVGTEALVVTLDGAADADLETVVAESGLTPIAKTPGRIVALLWYSDETVESATKKVGKALDRLRPEKPKLQVEARYLCASEVVQV